MDVRENVMLLVMFFLFLMLMKRGRSIIILLLCVVVYSIVCCCLCYCVLLFMLLCVVANKTDLVGSCRAMGTKQDLKVSTKLLCSEGIYTQHWIPRDDRGARQICGA